ncbi:MAG: hypothetical protein IJ223_00755 [Clostridia bacterium]|nr:hypothetical protein [Clostridia bacterium]
MEADEVKQEIIRLYYEEHKRPSEIAPIIKKTPQYVSKIVTKDKRYKKEKQYKKQQSLERKKAYNKEYSKSYVRNAKEKEDREEYYKLLARIDKDNKVLSTKTEMSDVDFAKWNRSIYDYANNSSNLVVKKDINVTFDVPKIVRNVVQASSIRSSRVY